MRRLLAAGAAIVMCLALGVPALAQVASILGLWIGVAERPLARFDRSFEDVALGRERSDLVLVFRSFTRIVTAAPIARHEVSRAMHEVMGQDVNVVLPSTKVAIETDPGSRIAAFIDTFAGRVLQDASLTTFEPRPAPAKQKTSPKAIFGEFMKFSGQEIKALPREWYWRIAQRIQRWMQGKAESEGEIAYEIVVRDDVPPDSMMAEVFEQRLEANRKGLALNLPPRPSSSVPRMWQALRGGAFSLLDGSPMPEELQGLERRSDRNNPMVLPLSTMSVPRPEPWTVQFEEPRRFGAVELTDAHVYPGDPETADRVLGSLTEAIDALAEKRGGLAQDLQALEEELKAVRAEQEAVAVELEVVEAALNRQGDA